MDATSHSMELRWKEKGYNGFRMRVHEVPGDGSCLVHALCFCVYVPYHTRKLNGVHTTRKHIVRAFRDQIADKLTEVDALTGNTYYDSLKLDFKNVPEYKLERITSVLRSNDSLSITEIFIIERILGLNIYVLDENEEDVYVTGELHRDRRSVVIYHSFNHFRPVSLVVSGDNVTHFEKDHPFIQHLRGRHDRGKKATIVEGLKSATGGSKVKGRTVR